jgi:Ser/Thr protein kinase RdoA (MazF antagonist)
VHALRAPLPGEFVPDSGGIATEPSISAYVAARLAEWRARALRIEGALDPEDLALMEEVAREAERALAEPTDACCVHLDHHHGNLHVERAAEGFRVSGIFDLMSCAFGDGEQDLSRSVALFAREDDALARAFLEGYTARLPLRPGARERFRLYMLIDQLIFWEYGRRNRVWYPEALRFRDSVASSLALDRLLA